ncbi:MAG: efflux RND transporter periplasmic adaptor subunit [Bryobacteraceae bacterium]
MKRILKRALMVVVVIGMAAGVAYVFRTQPVVVDTGRVARGAMQVSIDEDGQTRAHDRFTLASPIAGYLSRIELHEGDPVRRGMVIASVSPMPIDPREESEIRARIDAAEALRREAVEQLARAETNHDLTKKDLQRAEMLVKDDVIPRQQYDQAKTKEMVAAKDVEAARHKVDAAAADVKRAEAGLISYKSEASQKTVITWIRSPIDSRVLRILEKSERVITAGTPVVTLSNPGKIEIVADVLSTEAVNVMPGMPVSVENWGGPQALRARVRMVEPYGFTKVSALGVEEQRVNVIADFVDPPGKLGDGYKVDVRIVTWDGNNVLKVPTSALFRSGQNWSAFTIQNGKAVETPLHVGQRNAMEAEVLGGLAEGAEVIVHPSNSVKNGTAVTVRMGGT